MVTMKNNVLLRSVLKVEAVDSSKTSKALPAYTVSHVWEYHSSAIISVKILC
jgi:hypothetical protein